MKKLGGGPGGALDVVENKSALNLNGTDNFDCRYSNLKLNENYKCSNISSLVQSDSKLKKHDKTFGKEAAVRRNHNKVTYS
uniref:CYCLOIDEA-like protein n=1 Tax=Panagrolaimus sp. PS1159 TaxID=55785 RepID=A0AC35ESJ3_9BILA